MNYSIDSDLSSASDWSNASWMSNSTDFSVFVDDSKDTLKRLPAPEKLRCTAQQLAEMSAAQHFPIFTDAAVNKCAKLHWACLVGWCLCKYQYQPLTPLHLLPITPITDYQVWLVAAEKMKDKLPEGSVSRNISKNENESQRKQIEPKPSVLTKDTKQTIIYEYETTV